MPSELQQLIDAIDACERDAAALLSDLDDTSVNWRPPPGSGWSIGQCLNHLTAMNRFYIRGCLQRVEQARSDRRGPFAGLRPTMWGRWFVRSMDAPAKVKMKSPSQVVPASTFTHAELLPAFTQSHDEYRRLVNASADVDVNRVVLTNPFIKPVRMRLSTMLLLIPAHDRRHLWQGWNVRRALKL